MGTAGPLGLARDILDDGSGDPFFVLNRCEGAERSLDTLQSVQMHDMAACGSAITDA